MQSAVRSRVIVVKTSAALPPKFRSNSWLSVWPDILFHCRCILYLEEMSAFTRQQTRFDWQQDNRILSTNHTQWSRGLHMILKIVFLNSLHNIWQSVVYQKIWYIKFYVLILTGFRVQPYSGEDRGSTVVKVLCYKSEGRWFGSRWCQWNFSLTSSFRSH